MENFSPFDFDLTSYTIEELAKLSQERLLEYKVLFSNILEGINKSGLDR